MRRLELPTLRHAVRRALVVASVAAVAVPLGSWSGSVSPSQPDGWTQYRDEEDGFTVSYPSSWNRAEDILTPALEDPREVLVVGTGPMLSGGEECAQYPENAIEGMGAAGALVSLQEAAGPLQGRHTIDRPARFRLGDGYESGATDCLPGSHALYSGRMIPFRDGGRSFFALLVFGPDASDDVKTDALRVLDSLHVD